MESTKHSLSLTSQPQSTKFPYSSSSATQLQGGYMGQQMGYSYCTQQHELFAQYNNLYPSSGILPASLFPDKREVILREIEKERVRAQMMVTEIAKMRILQEKIGKEEVTRVGATESPPDDIFLKKIKSLGTMFNKTELLENLKPGMCETNQIKRTQSVQKNPDLKKTMWCEMCQVGACSEITMNAHEKGKKHLKRLKRRAENWETVLGCQNEKMEVPLDCVQHVSEGGKNIIVDNVTVCEKGGYNSVNESKVEEIETALEVTEQDEVNAQRVDIVEPGSNSTVDAFLPEDEIIAKGELRQTERRSFLPDTFVLRENELLEHSKFDQFKAEEVRVSEVKCGIQYEQEEEEIVLMVNPDAKSKVVTPPVADNNIYPSGNSIIYGKAEIIGTSEPALNKASLKQQSSEKNTTIVKIAADTVLLKQTELLEKQKPGKSKKDKERINKSVQTNGDSKKSKFSFWCEMCQIGAPSEIVMNDHEKGKKHLRLLEDKARKDDSRVDNQENIEVPMNCVGHVSESGKGIPACNVDVVLAEASSDLHIAFDSGFETSPLIRAADLKVLEIVPVTENCEEEEKVIYVGNPDATISGSKSKAVTPPVEDISKNQSDILSEKAKVIDVSESVSNGSLKSQYPGKGSSIENIAANTMLLDQTKLLESPKQDNLKRAEEKTNQSVQKNVDPKKTKYSFWCEMCQVGALSKTVMNAHEKRKKHLRLLKDKAQKDDTRVDKKENVEVAVDCVEHVSESGKSIPACNVDVVLAEASSDLHIAFETFPLTRAADLKVLEIMPVTEKCKEEETVIYVGNHDTTIYGSKSKAVTPPVEDISKHQSDILFEKAKVIDFSESISNGSVKSQNPGKGSSIENIAANKVLMEQAKLLESSNSDNFKKDQYTNQSSQNNGDPKKMKYSFWCEMCQVGALSKTVMNAHEKGKKHLRRLLVRVQKSGTGNGPVSSVDHVCDNKKDIDSCHVDAVLVEARLDFHKSLNASDTGHKNLPIPIRASDLRVSETMPVTDLCSEEDSIIFMANPDATISESKSTAVTPPVADTSKHPSNEIVYEKAEVTATSDSAFNEACLRLHSPGKNCSIVKNASDTMLKQTELLDYSKTKCETDQSKRIQIVKKNPDLKKTMWCEMCQVGVCSEIIMNDHEKGKKHLKRLKRRAENGENVLGYWNEKMEVQLDCIQHVSEGGKNIIVENITVCEKGGYNSVNESKVEEYETALEVTEQDEINAQRGDIVEPGSDLTVDSFLPEDEIITKEELRQTEKKSFLPDTFVLREIESLEHSKFDQFKTAEVRVSEVKCSIQNEHEEEEIVLMVNPDAKSKVVTPPVADNNIYPSGNSIIYGKAEIIGTSEPALNKASLKQQSSEKNTTIVKIAADTVLLKQTELLDKQKPEKSKKDKEIINKSVQTNGDSKKSKFSFWCEMCQIGAPSEIVMNGHEKGKKHLRLLEDKARKDDSRVDNQENIEVPMNCVGHVSESGKGIPACNVDVVLAEASSDLHFAFDSGFETSPLIRAADLKVLEIVPVTENCEEEEKVIYVGNPDATISGSKSKAVTPPVEDISKNQSDILSEKAKVIDVSESVSNGSLKSQYPGKGSSIENIAANTMLLEQTKLLESPKQDNLKRAEEKTNQSVQKNVDPKKTKYSFWCEMCQVGALSKTVMNAHEKGKKHLSRLLVRAQKSGTVNGPVNSVYHGSDSRKGIASCHVDAVLIEASSDLHKPLEASDTGHKNLPIPIRVSDIFMANPDATVSESKSTAVTPPVADTSKHPSDKIVYEKAEVTTTSESALNEACLKLQSPGKNSSIVQNASDTMLKRNELLDYSKPDNLTTGQETIQSVQRNSGVNKTTYSFWCEMCQIETLSEIDMNCHEKGRKHLRRLEERTKQGESRKSNQKVAIDVPANYIDCISDNGKSILSHGADLVLDEARLELLKPLDASPTGFETLPVQMTASTVSESKSKAVTPNVEDITKHPCDILPGKTNVIAVSESVFDGSSLKPQSPGKSSSIGKISDGTAFNKTELPECPKQDNLTRAQEKTNQSVQKNVDPKKTKYIFWCEMCQVGALSETVMNAHEKGKKHLRRLLVRVQKSGTGNGPVNYVYHGSDSRKGIASCHVDAVLIEAHSDLHKPLEASDTGHKILRAADLRVSEAMPVTDNFNEEETIIFMANPDATISGSNSNTVTPPVADISKHLSDKCLYKKAEVVAVSESVSNGSSLKLQSHGKNSSIEKNAADTVLLEQTKLLENSKSDNCKKDESNTNQKAHKNADLKKTTYNFWCELCQVGMFSEIVMYDHEKGNKHLRRVEERTQKGETGEGSQKENIEMPVNSVEHAFESGKSILTCNVDVVLDEARLELRKPLNASYNRFETSQVQIGPADRGVSEVTPLTENGTEEEKYVFVDNPDATIFESKSKDVTLPVANFSKSPSDNIFLKKTEAEWSCAICLVNFISESALNKHLWRKEHKFREGALKPRSLSDDVSSDIMLNKSILLENPKPRKYQTDEAKRFRSVSKNPDLKKTMYNFWCEMCQLGVSSEIILNDHKKGKKHIKRLKGRAENGETALGNQNEKMEVPSYCVQHVSEAGKNIVVENVNVYEKGSYKSVNESKTEKNEINAQRADVVEQGSDSTADAFLPEDEIIAKRDLRETEMRSFLHDTTVLKNTERNEIMQNGDAGPCDLKQDIDPVNLVRHIPEVGQFIFPHISTKKDAKAAGVDIIRPGVSSTLRAVSPKDGISEWKCELCQVIAPNKSSLDEHLCGKKHKLKEASLKTQRPRNNSSDKVVEEEKGRKRNEIVQNGEAGPCDLKQDTEPVNLVKHIPEVGQFIFPHISTKEDAKAAGVDIIRPGVSSTLCAVSPKDGNLNAISEWKCELCQVIATNKSSLNEHLCGKKHKLKEASLKTQRPRNNSSDKVDEEKRNEIVQNGEVEPCDLKQDVEPVNLVKHLPQVGQFIFPHISTKEDAKAMGVDLIKSGVSSTLRAVSPKDGKLIAISEWKCDLCQVIATNNSSLNEHLCGKKHKMKEASLKAQRPRNNSSNKVVDEEKGRERNEIVQNCEAGPCDLKQDIEPVNLVKHFPEVGQFIFPHISTKEDAKASGVNIIRSRVSSTLRAVSPKDGKLIAISEWKCDLCQVIAMNNSSLNEHLCGKKHKLKVASLKGQRPRNNSSVGNGAADTVLENPKSDNIKKDSPKAVRNVGQKGDLKKTTYSYRCQSSAVEPSEKIAHNVEKGKETVQNGESGSCNQKRMKLPVNRVEHVSNIEKSIFSDFFGVVFG